MLQIGAFQIHSACVRKMVPFKSFLLVGLTKFLPNPFYYCAETGAFQILLEGFAGLKMDILEGL